MLSASAFADIGAKGTRGGVSRSSHLQAIGGRIALAKLDIERPHGVGACVVHLDGEVDLSIVPELREELEELVETGCVHVVLDLGGVTYVDSTALGLIVWLDRQLAPAQGKLVLTGANRDVGRILELSGLVDIAPTLSTRDSVGEALVGLEPGSSAGEALRWSESMMLPAQIDALADVRQAVCDLLGTVELSESALFDVKVAVGEALANAVRHGSPGGEADQIRVDVSAYQDRIVVQVRDRGAGFTPGGPDDEDGNVYASSGRGVLFMRALMDDVGFARDESTGGTVVTLEKRLALRKVSEDDEGESSLS
jgi:anti-anti-sigma factor